MTGCNDGILGCPYEGDERKSSHPDCVDYGTGARINDANGAIMTLEMTFDIRSIETNAMNSPANESTSPDGEKATVCTQPPAGVVNSPQTVPNGSLSPQNVGAGLKNNHKSTISPGTKGRTPPLVNVLDVCREYTSLHVCTSSGQQDVVRVPVDRKDGRPDRFLEELRNPPVALFIKGAYRDSSDINRLASFRVARMNNALSRT